MENEEREERTDDESPAEGGAERYGGDQDAEEASQAEQPGSHDDDDQAEG